MIEAILTLNAGSSSLKFQAFAVDDLSVLLAGKVTGIGGDAVLALSHPEGAHPAQPQGSDHHAALAAVIDCIDRHDNDWEVAAIAHRIVHGGTRYAAPVEIDDAVMAALAELVPLAPLHQPHNLEAVEASRALLPDALDIACFDTGFHAGQDPLFTTMPLPASLRDDGFRRYGFHGISYEWIARRLRADHPGIARGRVVAAHLGNGASMCAMAGGRSVDTSMGMTALDGLPMGTRCGAIDPGAVTMLMRRGMDADAIDHVLYHESGLKGLSGLTNDVAALIESNDPQAKFALGVFALRIAQFAGRMAVSMGGLDALVFTAGIGENAASVRDAVVARLSFLPAFQVLVIPTDEERMMAIHARELMAGAASCAD